MSLQAMGVDKHRFGRLGRTGAQEVVAAVDELMQVDLIGQKRQSR
jgi:hypothetical protein